MDREQVIEVMKQVIVNGVDKELTPFYSWDQLPWIGGIYPVVTLSNHNFNLRKFRELRRLYNKYNR